MITANDVLAVLSSNYDTESYLESDLLPCCESGLSWVNMRLRQGVKDTDPMIVQAAAAIARFRLFIMTMSHNEGNDSYRAGDVSVSYDRSKALEREKVIRDIALADAASILTDGGFYCCGDC